METQEQAIAAVEKLQGVSLFGKPMRLAFARSKSDASNPPGTSSVTAAPLFKTATRFCF
jgi:RNA recognition motif-containing protein